MCLMPYANNKGADAPAHPRSLISAIVVRCLDSLKPILGKSKLSGLKVVSVAEQASYLVANPRRQDFSRRGSYMKTFEIVICSPLLAG